jgi:hypothetical protein
MLATYTQAYATTQAASPSASSRTFTLRSYFQVLGLRITSVRQTATAQVNGGSTWGLLCAGGGRCWLLRVVRGHLGGTPVLLIIPLPSTRPSGSGPGQAGQDAAPHRTNDLDRLGLVCWACPLVDGRRDDQAPHLSQHDTVAGSPWCSSWSRSAPAGGSGFTVRRQDHCRIASHLWLAPPGLLR